LFFIDTDGAQTNLESAIFHRTPVFFSPPKTFVANEAVAPLDIFLSALDNIVINGTVAKLDISPSPGYYPQSASERWDAGIFLWP